VSFSKSAESLFQRIAEVRGGSPQDFAEEIHRIRFWLTEARDKRPSGYMNDPRAFSGYLSYHLPLHLPELFWILDRTHERGLLGSPPKTVLDMGCGPGTASLSLLLWLRSQNLPDPQELHLVDISKRALDTARNLLSSFSDLRPRTYKVDKGRGVGLPPSGGPRADWILISHVLNELGNGPRFREKKMQYLESLAKRHLNPGGTIFVIEPPLREPTLDLNTMRDFWVDPHEVGGNVVAPCPTHVKRCPILLQKRGWCYSQPPRTWARAKGLAPLDRELEKTLVIELTNPGFSYLVLRMEPPIEESNHEIGVTDASMKPPMACTPRGLRAATQIQYRGEWLKERQRQESGPKGSPRPDHDRDDES